MQQQPSQMMYQQPQQLSQTYQQPPASPIKAAPVDECIIILFIYNLNSWYCIL